MKKILEVTQYGDMDIRFNTDIDVSKHPEIILDIIGQVSFVMSTKLWGGNEQSVLAMVRALAISDLSLCTNRKAMLRYLDDSSSMVANSFKIATEEFRKKGGEIAIFGPGIMPGKTRS